MGGLNVLDYIAIRHPVTAVSPRSALIRKHDGTALLQRELSKTGRRETPKARTSGASMFHRLSASDILSLDD
jgi:hypothetical protein